MPNDRDPRDIHSNHELRLRAANLEDAGTLARFRLRLLTELGAAGHEPTSAEALADYFRRATDSGECLSWIVESQGQAVGVGSINFFYRIPAPKNPSGREIYLLNMYTLTDFRGCGVAALILQAVKDYARLHGFGRIWLHASQQGESLYRRHGFASRPAEMELFLAE